MSSPRIKGTALSMRVGDPAVDHWADATAVVMDKDTEFHPLFDGGYQYTHTWFFDVTAVQSTDPDSFWTFLWEHSEEVVPFAYGPHGNQTPTLAQPHFTGLLQVPPPPALGGDAGEFSEYTFTSRMFIIQGPLRVTE